MRRVGTVRRAVRGSRIGTRILIASLALCSLLASSAGANVVVDPVTGQKFGTLPVPQVPMALSAARPLARIAAAGTPTCDQSVDSQCATPLTYHGGPVQHGENVILFFWDPASFSSSPSYVTDMQNWVNGLAAGDFSTGNASGSAVGNPISVTQEYYDMSGPGGTKSFVPYAVHNGGTVFDTDPYPSNGCTDTYTDANNQTVTLPKCLNSGQLFGELHSYIQEHNLPLGIDTEYFVLTPQGVGTCQDSLSHSCAYAQYCAWHVDFGSPSNLPGQVILADMPWLAGTPCDPTQSPSSPSLYSSGIDRVVDAFSHELAETMTDPDISGWYGAGGDQDEIGDKCDAQYSVGQPMDNFTGLPQTSSGAPYNTTLSGRDYLLQMEYDNRAAGCTQWDTDAQPTAAISGPSQASAGSPAAFSLSNVSAPAGVAYVTWYFGDGAATRATSTGSVQHTYTSAGGRAVTAILTDNDGNEVKLTKSLTVASAVAKLLISVSPVHPAPKAPYTVRLAGRALPGGVFGAGHNRSDVELYDQFGGTCASTWGGERSRASAGRAHDLGKWLVGSGAFSFIQHRQARPSQHATARFCGYVSRSATRTDAQATALYTTT